MSDLIDRQAAIAVADSADYVGLSVEDCKKVTDVVVKGLKQLPSVQEWIPVTEGLPKHGETVLITNDKGNVRSGRFRGVEFWKDDGDAYWTFKGNTVEHVVAWMPLPEPYKGEK